MFSEIFQSAGFPGWTCLQRTPKIHALPGGKRIHVYPDGRCFYMAPGHRPERISRETAAFGLGLARRVVTR